MTTSTPISREQFHVDLPEGERGGWTVSRADGPLALSHRGEVWMQIIPVEIDAHWGFCEVAHGHVLILGLGLGMCLDVVARKAEVEHVTVVERAPEVIELVGAHYLRRFGSKISLIEADALKWEPPAGVFYDVAWFDIWRTIAAENLPEIDGLERRLRPHCGWMDSWSRDQFP